jgi:hypothetical protein
MELVILTVSAILFTPPVFACEKLFSVFQNGPNVVLELTMKQAQGEKIPKEAADLVAQFMADQDRYWLLKVKSDPVCSTKADPHDCISQCKNRPAAVVKAATYNENGVFYSLPLDERTELEKEEATLEKKWEKWEYYK